MKSRMFVYARYTLLLALAVATPTWAQEATQPPPMHDHSAHEAGQAMQHDPSSHGASETEVDPHAAHRAAMAQQRYSVTEESYVVPPVTLIDQSGNAVALASLLDGDDPIALNFIFTTCTTICPVMTATFAQMRRELGEQGAALRLVSISIDPEYDRPEVLKDYAASFHADDRWSFLTGDGADISAVLTAFKSYFGSKMNHQPVTLLKRPGNPSWIRIEGLAGGKDLAGEVTTRLLP